MRTGRAAGYTYVVVLIWVALAGIGLAITGELWRTTAQREREAELLFIGEEFKRAITSYYESSPGVQRFPASLAALVRDERYPTVRRHLRKIYVDPMTGTAQWGLVKQPEGGIVGVYSLSFARPLRTGNFTGAQEEFAGKQKYSDWVFRSEVAAVVMPNMQTTAPAAMALPSGAPRPATPPRAAVSGK
jgi:type II secretory pathway pseudopilin PulG